MRRNAAQVTIKNKVTEEEETRTRKKSIFDLISNEDYLRLLSTEPVATKHDWYGKMKIFEKY